MTDNEYPHVSTERHVDKAEKDGEGRRQKMPKAKPLGGWRSKNPKRARLSPHRKRPRLRSRRDFEIAALVDRARRRRPQTSALETRASLLTNC